MRSWVAWAPRAGARSSQATRPAAHPHLRRRRPVRRHSPSSFAGRSATAALARRLLATAWVVADLAVVADTFTGVAVTVAGRAWIGGTRELRQAPEGGSERVLAERNRRDQLIAETELAASAERAALSAIEAAGQAVAAAEASREQADTRRREATRGLTAAQEAERRARADRGAPQCPDQGAGAVRRAQLDGELAAERRVAERAAREREERAAAIERLSLSVARDTGLGPAAERLADVLRTALEAVAERVGTIEQELLADRREGEGVATELRACAQLEAQPSSSACASWARASPRPRSGRSRRATRRPRPLPSSCRSPSGSELVPEPGRGGRWRRAGATALRDRIARLNRRREQLGPVNPLAQASTTRRSRMSRSSSVSAPTSRPRCASCAH